MNNLCWEWNLGTLPQLRRHPCHPGRRRTRRPPFSAPAVTPPGWANPASSPPTLSANLAGPALHLRCPAGHQRGTAGDQDPAVASPVLADALGPLGSGLRRTSGAGACLAVRPDSGPGRRLWDVRRGNQEPLPLVAVRAAAPELLGCDCEACDSNSGERHGEAREGFIKVLHGVPLSEAGRAENHPEEGLCANGHRDDNAEEPVPHPIVESEPVLPCRKTRCR